MLHRRVLALREKAFGENHPDVLRTLDHLGSRYRERGKYATRKPCSNGR